MATVHPIPARKGLALPLQQGQQIKVINTHGQQVVDTWAFAASDLQECLSMEHSRPFWGRLTPTVGDALLSNHRRPLLTLVADTSPGIHDTLVAACDRYRYELLGCQDYHDNCTDNLHQALQAIQIKAPEVPSPLNLFMNVPVTDNHRIEFAPPISNPGDYVILRAEMDCIVVFSACPQDIVPINGVNCQPTEAHVEVL